MVGLNVVGDLEIDGEIVKEGTFETVGEADGAFERVGDEEGALVGVTVGVRNGASIRLSCG